MDVVHEQQIRSKYCDGVNTGRCGSRSEGHLAQSQGIGFQRRLPYNIDKTEDAQLHLNF